MIGTVVFGNTFIILIGVICVFLSILSAIYAIHYTINQKDEQKFKKLTFLSSLLAALSYFILLFILDV